nr:MAG TPA: hypothetical protein [Caudoviricetes sp.]
MYNIYLLDTVLSNYCSVGVAKTKIKHMFFYISNS